MREHVLIFGAGQGGQRAQRFLRDRYRILGFVDNSERLIGRQIAGLEVLSPDRVLSCAFDKILIASGRGYEIYDQLLSLGIEDRRIEFVPGDVLGGRYELPVRLFKQFALLFAAVILGVAVCLWV